jgi:hypothetical protein
VSEAATRPLTRRGALLFTAAINLAIAALGALCLRAGLRTRRAA